MARWLWRGALLMVIGVAALLRLGGLDWDGFEHYHPDERYIAWVATSIEAPQNWRTAFNPRTTSFNPYYWPATAESPGILVPQGAPRDFAYGHLPLYAGVLATRLMERLGPLLRPITPAWPPLQALVNTPGRVEFDHLTAVGRGLTALADLTTLLTVYALGWRLFGRAAGLLAAALLALNVMHIQLAHFYTVDPYMTLFVVLSVTCVVVAVQGESRCWLMPAALAAGLAIGSKFSATLLALPLLLGWWWAGRAGGRLRAVGTLAALGALALLAFALTNPFALLDWSCSAITRPVTVGPITLPSLEIGNCFFYNIGKQANMVGGSLLFPFTRQYIGTRPYFYFIEMQLRWGMGPLLGVAAFGGLLWAAVRGARAVRLRAGERRPLPPTARAEWIVLAWCVPFFVSTGSFDVKFMRYLQPLTPFLMVYAAALLLALPRARLRAAAVTLTLGSSALFALAFGQIYSTLHPWVTASAWVYANLPPGATIAVERWGEPLPSSLRVDGQLLAAREFGYRQPELTWLSGIGAADDARKLAENAALLADADYLIVDSNRIYGVVPRLPALYPLSAGYYPALFSGDLGYAPVFVTTRAPHLGGWHLKPDWFGWPELTPPPAVQAFLAQQNGLTWGRADESFTLYDQSLVMIFENRARLSAETLAERITAAAAARAER